MKTLIIPFILLFAISMLAQTKTSEPTAAELVRQYKIQKSKTSLSALKITRSQLLEEFSPTAYEVKQVDKAIQELEQEIIRLEKTKDAISPETLPDDTIFLLKLLIVQNEQIIRLLERKNK